MADIDVAVLFAALRSSETCMRAAVTTIAPTPAALLTTVLGQAPNAGQQTALTGVATAVQTQLTAAHGATDQLQAALAGGPTDLAGLAGPCADLATALGGLAGAIGTIAGAVNGAPARAPGLEAVLKAAVTAGPVGLGGLVTQLGLAAPAANLADAIDVTGTVVTVTLANPANRELGAGALLTLQNSVLTIKINWTDPTSFGVHLQTGLAAGVVSDAFVAQLLPGAGKAPSNLGISIDTVKGLTFGAGVRHRIALPGKIDLPGIDFRDFAIELPLKSELSGTSSPNALELTATIAGALGPIKAVVDGTGLQLVLDTDAIASGHGAPASIEAKPPTGAGLTVDVGPVKGGGYVSHSGHDYGGALDLAIGPIEIKAVGLISTDPFSMVLVLSVEFLPGIQLSFGFTLNGVGGLVALERTVSLEALRAGLHSHSLDSLLFPPDPVSAAPHILNALRADFPPDQGSFVVGPMVELGWGTPISYVTAKVGVLLALPDPKIIIIGSVRVALPAPAAPIIDLRADLYGEITPEHILLLVSVEGKAAGFTLTGDFGLLIGFGDDPEFAISAGGFHPHYKPPAELVGMRRVTVDMSPPALLTMRADAYFALTSNSFQLGAHVQLRADVGPVGAEGHLGFDAIVRWAPRFSFEIDLDAGITLYAFGMSFASIDLHLSLSGPGPWSAHGTASISLFFFDIDFEVGPITWGQGDNPPPDSVSPVDLVYDALADAGAWHPVAPDQGDRVAGLRDVKVADAILVHPLGGFEVRQRAVPLETDIDCVGSHPVSEPRVNLGAPQVNGHAVDAVSATTDRFAPGQYLKLSDDQKLSTPAFENLPSGMRFSGVEGDSRGTAVESTYQWLTVYPKEELDHRLEAVMFDHLLTSKLLEVGPAGAARFVQDQAYAVVREPVGIVDPGQVTIRSTRDLESVAGVDASSMTTTAARRVMASLVDAGAAAEGSLQLIGPGVQP